MDQTLSENGWAWKQRTKPQVEERCGIKQSHEHRHVTFAAEEPCPGNAAAHQKSLDVVPWQEKWTEDSTLTSFTQSQTFSDLVPNLVITTVVSTEPHVSCCKWYSSYKRALQNASASVLANEFLKCMHLTNTVVSIHINVNCSSCWAPISIFWQNVSLKYIGEVNVIW